MAKIKKLLALGLCLCMAAGITVGCGNSKSSKNGTDSGKNTNDGLSFAFCTNTLNNTFQSSIDSKLKELCDKDGGAPVNMLTAAAKAGLRTAFIGKVGNDMHGKFLIEAVENQNINSNGIILDDNVFTTLAFVNLTKDGERSFAFARKPGADTMIGYKEVDTQILQNTKVFHVGSLSLTDEPARSTTFQAVKCAKNAGAVISYDPNYRAPLWNDEKTAIERMRSMLPFADMIKLSDEETALLTPYENPDEAANYLLDHGIKIVAVTLGKEGVLICNRKDHQKVSGFSSQVVDTTGAGDSFWGGFMSQFVKSKLNPEDCSMEELKKFARYGNAVASLCIEKKGGILSIPEEKETFKRLQLSV